MTPEQYDALITAGDGLKMLAFNLAVFFKELLKHDFTREEALEITRDWQRGFLEFRSEHAAEEDL